MSVPATIRNDTARNPLIAPRSAPPKVKGKLRDAIELIVFEGMAMQDAAKRVGLATRAIRDALSKPHVISHMRARREVFRTEVCGANIHRLRQIRDAAENMPAVNSIGMLERLGDDPSNAPTRQQSPGPVIVIALGNGADGVQGVKTIDISTAGVPLSREWSEGGEDDAGS